MLPQNLHVHFQQRIVSRSLFRCARKRTSCRLCIEIRGDGTLEAVHPRDDRRLTAWRESVEKNAESTVAVYYNANIREAAWTCRSRCHAVDPLNGVYLCKISLSQQY